MSAIMILNRYWELKSRYYLNGAWSLDLPSAVTATPKVLVEIKKEVTSKF